MGTVIPGILCQSIELSKMKVNNQEELDAFKALKQRQDIKEAIPKSRPGQKE